eukprot:TRINITY_DN20286_c0_g1_i1.p1 TRINITY_DN20286_c0_g1~~TRINITY_DN20286_c0_g1_i1.p1  ORF type:complete len:640 (+),score=94.01 TRINITY_DN20286_c0_g1_i1:66-1922(+)
MSYETGVTEILCQRAVREEADTDRDGCVLTLTGADMFIPYTVVVAASESDREVVSNVLYSTFTDVDTKLNNWNPDSEIESVNKTPIGTHVDVSEPLAEVLAEVEWLVTNTKGAFNPCVGAYVMGNVNADIPDWFEAVSFHQTARRISRKKDVTIDLCGVSKGWCVDTILDRLTAMNYTEAYVEWGGEVKCTGTWDVKIQNPLNKSQPAGTVKLTDRALATSGLGGKTGPSNENLNAVNPTTKTFTKPAQGNPSAVTIITTSCMRSDGLATAVMSCNGEKTHLFPIEDFVMQTTGSPEATYSKTANFKPGPSPSGPHHFAVSHPVLKRIPNQIFTMRLGSPSMSIQVSSLTRVSHEIFFMALMRPSRAADIIEKSKEDTEVEVVPSEGCVIVTKVFATQVLGDHLGVSLKRIRVLNTSTTAELTVRHDKEWYKIPFSKDEEKYCIDTRVVGFHGKAKNPEMVHGTGVRVISCEPPLVGFVCQNRVFEKGSTIRLHIIGEEQRSLLSSDRSMDTVARVCTRDGKAFILPYEFGHINLTITGSFHGVVLGTPISSLSFLRASAPLLEFHPSCVPVALSCNTDSTVLSSVVSFVALVVVAFTLFFWWVVRIYMIESTQELEI